MSRRTDPDRKRVKTTGGGKYKRNKNVPDAPKKHKVRGKQKPSTDNSNVSPTRRKQLEKERSVTDLPTPRSSKGHWYIDRGVWKVRNGSTVKQRKKDNEYIPNPSK